MARVHKHLTASDVPELLKRRFQIINIWRPIGNPAFDWPLGLCDYRSVDPSDVVPVALIYPDHEGETLGVKYNPNHKWNYFRGMTPEEVVLIKWCARLTHFFPVDSLIIVPLLLVLILFKTELWPFSPPTPDSMIQQRPRTVLCDSPLRLGL